MAFVLGPASAAAGYRLAAFETIGSTNSEAMARARAGDPGRLWVVARHQSAGRGRRGRTWHTPSGNLAATLLVLVSVEPRLAATLGFCAGLALENALRRVAPRAGIRVALDGGNQTGGSAARLQLKWPNDVLMDGRKIAGILLEASALPDGRQAIAIGFGVNVAEAPSDVPYPAVSMGECGSNASAEDLFEALSDTWVEQMEIWDEGRGFDVVRSRWLTRAAGLGSPIAVKNGGEVMRGVFETIDSHGMLVVRAEDGRLHHVSAGDVHFSVAATVN